MTRSREEALLYSLAAYFAVSVFLTAALLLGALAGMKLVFALARFSLGPERIYWLKPLIYDSAGFAMASSVTALLHYYLVSLLRFTSAGRAALSAAVFLCAVLCGLLFWRGAAYSSLGAYGFSGLCVTTAALIGGLGAAFQKPGENPWPASFSAYFK